MNSSPAHRSGSLPRWVGGLLTSLILISPLSRAAAAPLPQTEITSQAVLDALSTWFATFSGYEFSQRGWVTVGDLAKARARLEQWDVEVYIDPNYLNETKAAAAYVDYTNAGLGYFNDLVFATDPANVAGATVWHEVMHAIFDAHDDELLVTSDEIYTWYMEGQVVGLGYLMAFENELRSADCNPEDLEREWTRFNHFMTISAIDFGTYGAISDAGKDQLTQLTGFQVPDPATLRGLYESSGLLEKCGGTPTPGPTSTQAALPTQTQKSASTGKTTSSRMFLLDNSGSMEGERILAAINSAQATLRGLSPTTEVAAQFFGVYGCEVAVVQDFTLDHTAASQVIADATAWGDTPLGAAISQGGAYMRSNASTDDLVMILLSDGLETCDGDPVDAAGQLNGGSSGLPSKGTPLAALIRNIFQPGIQTQGAGTITLHVVGLGITPGSEEDTQLRAIAAAGGGNYYQADDEVQLTEALQQAAEDSRSGSFAGPGLWICGGSLLCLLGLVLVVGLIILITRRLKKTAESSGVKVSGPISPAIPPEEAPADPVKTAPKAIRKKTTSTVCDSCGAVINPDDKTCSQCGAPR